VVLTLWDNAHYLKAVSKMAIDAMMHKSSSAEELLATIGAVSRNPDGGNAVISLPRDLLQRLGDEPAGGLSERELEVLVLAAHGLSNRLIGEELHISEATVKRHLANVYEKIGVRSRNEAVRTALVEQWIGLHEITPADGNGSRDGGWDGTERRSGLDRRKGSGRWTGSERRGGSEHRNGSPGGPDGQGG
jgi:DNA-binding CsgD family transcriptional regulator